MTYVLLVVGAISGGGPMGAIAGTAALAFHEFNSKAKCEMMAAWARSSQPNVAAHCEAKTDE